MEKMSGEHVWGFGSSRHWERWVRGNDIGHKRGGMSCVTLTRRGADFENEAQALD